jgi:hypothetical protein
LAAWTGWIGFADSLGRLSDEYVARASCPHPGIVTTHDADHEDGTTFIVAQIDGRYPLQRRQLS